MIKTMSEILGVLITDLKQGQKRNLHYSNVYIYTFQTNTIILHVDNLFLLKFTLEYDTN